MGELPYHKPWWDADRLGLQPDWGMVTGIALLLVAALWAYFLPEMGVARNSRDTLLMALGLPLGLIFVIVWVSWLALGCPVVISRTELKNRGSFPFSRAQKLSSLYVVGTSRRKLLGKSVAVEVASSTMMEDGKATFISTMLLSVSAYNLSTLLTYRIAKAKGENPPPPEFN